MPKVSILVPIFNVEKYLRECLDSLVAQTLEDIEIICINDGSTDSSPQIIDEYISNDSRVKVINKENSGYGASMNMGLQLAQGEYIGIVESDDFVKNTMFEDLYNIAIKNDLDIVKSDFYYYLGGQTQARKAGKINKNFVGKVISVKDEPYILKIQPSIWSSIYRNEFLKNNDIKFLETPGASYQDTSFAFKTLSSANRIMMTNQAYLYYRQDNEASSVKSKEKVYVICEEWDEISRFLENRPEIKSIVQDVKLSIQFNTYRWNASRIDKKFRDDFIDKYQKTFKEFWDKNEIKKGFYKKSSKKELKMLLNNKDAYRKFIDDYDLRLQKSLNRRKNFSIRINPSRISIVLFGKQIIEIG